MANHLLNATKVMQGLIYFHMATEVLTKFISLCSTFWSQKTIYEYFKKIEDLSSKIMNLG